MTTRIRRESPLHSYVIKSFQKENSDSSRKMRYKTMSGVSSDEVKGPWMCGEFRVKDLCAIVEGSSYEMRAFFYSEGPIWRVSPPTEASTCVRQLSTMFLWGFQEVNESRGGWEGFQSCVTHGIAPDISQSFCHFPQPSAGTSSQLSQLPYKRIIITMSVTDQSLSRGPRGGGAFCVQRLQCLGVARGQVL